MPELPEVETVCNSLRPHLIGRIFKKITIRNSQLRYPLSEKALQTILNSPITRVKRRAKYIVIEFRHLEVLIIHLGMTGKCLIKDSKEAFNKHEHVEFLMDNGQAFRFDDVRRFGSICVERIEHLNTLPDFFKTHGPEPLENDFTTEYFLKKNRNKTKPIKNQIMDSKIVVGVGNIYASEALFHAKIHPESQAQTLNKSQATQLIHCIKQVLKDAIQAGGTTIKDYHSPDGTEGLFNRKLYVYGKEGEQCLNCKTLIQKIRLAGRSTFFCSTCQVKGQ